METMATVAKKQLLIKIDEFLKRHDMPPSTFGKLAAGSSSLMTRLKLAPSMRDTTAEKIRAFMANYDAEHAHDAKDA